MNRRSGIASLSILVGLLAVPTASWANMSSESSQEAKPGVEAEKDVDEPGANDEQQKDEQYRRRRGEGPRRWDTDGDGRMSAEEFPGPPDRFIELDRNEDGFIDRDEMPHGRSRGQHGPHGGKPMEHFDADGDGKISRQEFPGPDERFEKLDGNGDGFVSQEELSQRRRERERQSRGS